jgi:transcriptional regulator with XRE-family HTH domain
MKTFRQYVRSLPKAEQTAIARGTAAKVAALRLQDAREAAGLTQEALAERMGTSQANLSRLEHRADVKLSTLAEYVEALDGHLKVRVVFKGKKPVELVG